MLLLLRRAAGILAVVIAIGFALSPHAGTAAHSAGAQLHSAAQHHPCDGSHCNQGDLATCCGYSHCVAGLPQQPDGTSSVVQCDPPILSVPTVAQLAIDRRLDRPPKRA
jgi:hypothetical protein